MPWTGRLKAEQRVVVQHKLAGSLFVEGPPGCGKTTAGARRLEKLLKSGIAGQSILVLVPQRTLAGPYYEILQDHTLPPGGRPSIVTLDGLAQRMLDLFWPALAGRAGFANPLAFPTFLTLETAQYYMAHLVRPLFAEGYFESVRLSRSRLYSQILDNLNKAALVGFPQTEISVRLKSAWVGEPAQLRIYDDMQTCANLFREYCLQHNLMDFSLQVETFLRNLWPDPDFRAYLNRIYRHVIIDNLEEDTPVAHDFLLDWLPDLASALVIYDWGGGQRTFLGADPQSAYRLKAACAAHHEITRPLTASAPILGLAEELTGHIQHLSMPTPDPAEGAVAGLPFTYARSRYYPEMLDWVVGRIAELVQSGTVDPSQIVILAPYLPDALRFSLQHRLELAGVPYRSHRPSRSLRDEPAARCLLTLAGLAFPEWGFCPPSKDVVYAFMQAIEGLDLVRAQLLVDIVYRVSAGEPTLSTFSHIRPETQARLTYRLGNRYDVLRNWLLVNHSAPVELQTEPRRPEATVPVELDHCLSRLFGEVLSQPGFGFHKNLDAGRITANLIESIRKFRWALGETLAEEGISLGKEYLQTVQDGLVAAQYLLGWKPKTDAGVLIAPAFTFLLSNQPVDFQFWLSAGSRGWSERLEQPLTHPYVLSRGWQIGRPWTDLDETQAGVDQLTRMVNGLLRRCRQHVFLGLSELDEQGYEDTGPLLRAFQSVLIQHAASGLHGPKPG